MRVNESDSEVLSLVLVGSKKLKGIVEVRSTKVFSHIAVLRC